MYLKHILGRFIHHHFLGNLVCRLKQYKAKILMEKKSRVSIAALLKFECSPESSEGCVKTQSLFHAPPHTHMQSISVILSGLRHRILPF
jgi:hypothetical protein